MQVLIVTASRHGATTEIADAIAKRLAERGHEASVVDPSGARLAGVDAVIVGSAVYIGSWLKPARRFVEDHAAELSRVPNWLFSSGPLDGADAESLPQNKIETLMKRTNALGHEVFSGRLDAGMLGTSERLITRAVHAPEGDFRDWERIAAWADEVADTLVSEAAPSR